MRAEATLYDLADLMDEKGIRHVPIVEGTRPVGILTEADFVRHLAE